MASIDERNARLEVLKVATEAWASKKKKHLEDQVTFSKKVLRGRTGAERLASAPVSIAKELVQDSINVFLTGD